MPHLRKLIVVDSYAASRIREIWLDGHVHISGRNGRGKTTLIRLIPLFYGEQPSKVVRSSGNVVRSLRDFMFSRSTSYVAFEYENHDGIKLAILHYGADNSPQYHLADGPYFRDIFVEDDNLLEGGQLNRRLRMLGRNPSGALGVLQYRAIIQGTGTRLTAAEHRNLLRRFALVPSRSRLAGIERISSGMFSKDITFVALKRMAASVAYDEEDKQIVLNLSRKELEGFLPDFKAYQAVMTLEPVFQSANSAYVQGNVARHHQVLAAAKLKRLVIALGKWLDTCRQKEHEEEDVLSTLQRERREAMAAFDQEAGTIATEIERLTREIGQADREELDWQAKDIHSLIDLVTRLPALESDARDLTERQSTLVAKADSVSRKYQTLFAEEKARRNQAESDAQARLNTRIDELNRDIEALNAERESEIRALEESQAIETGAAHDAWQEAVEVISAIDQALAQMTVDPVLEQDVRKTQATLQTAEATARQAAESEGTALLALTHGEHELARHNQNLAGFAQKLGEASEKLSHLLMLENPDGNTLLHYLRANMPDWHADIARVVREDLLLRTDLTPIATNNDTSDDTLYGLAIDLARIEAGRAASEQSLAAEIDRAKAGEADARATWEDARRHQQALSQAVETARGDHREQITRRQQADNAITHCRQALAAARKRRDEELGERRGIVTARRAEANSIASSRKQAIDTLQKTHRQSKNDLRSGYETRTQALRSQQQDARKRHAEAQQELQAARRKALEGLEKLRLSELSDAGVDTEALQSLEADLRSAEAIVQRARDSAPEVDRYHRWIESIPPQRERNKQLRLQKTRDAEALRRRHEEDLARLTTRIANQETVFTNAKAGTTKARERLDLAEKAQQARLAGIDAEAAEDANEIALHWLLPEILTELDKAREQHQLHEKALRQHLGTLARTFRKQEFATTKVGEYANHLPDDYWTDARLSLDVLGDWYGTAHAQHRDILAGALRNGCGILRRFHDGLLEFQSNITGLSRELQASLASDMVFDAIKRLALRLSAQVERRDYWDALGRVLREHDRWQDAGFADLPGEALLGELQDFARHIPDGSLAEHPETLMDLEIEVDDGTDIKRVRNEADLKQVSSNGLSYLVLCLVFVAFANRARRNSADLWLSWALDEIGTIDEGNAKALLAMLDRNRIRLVSASPEAKESLQTLFDHRYEILQDFEIRRILGEDELPELPDGDLAMSPHVESPSRPGDMPSDAGPSSVPNGLAPWPFAETDEPTAEVLDGH